MHPLTAQDMASLRTTEIRRRSDRQRLALLARRRDQIEAGARPGHLRRALGWRLVDAGLRLALSADVRRASGPPVPRPAPAGLGCPPGQ